MFLILISLSIYNSNSAAEFPRRFSVELFLRFGLVGVDADGLLARVAGLEADDAVDLGEQRIILADADVGAGMEVRTALANKNVAREDELTVRALRPETLALAVSAVTGRTDAFFMCEQLQIHLKHDLNLLVPKIDGPRIRRLNAPESCEHRVKHDGGFSEFIACRVPAEDAGRFTFFDRNACGDVAYVRDPEDSRLYDCGDRSAHEVFPVLTHIRVSRNGEADRRSVFAGHGHGDHGSADRGDLNLGERLTMAALLTDVLLGLILEDDDLLALAVL